MSFPSGREASGPASDVGRAQVRQLIERAIDELPETLRLVFLLRDVDARSAEETAAALALDANTVTVRLHRARRLLRKRLDETIRDALPHVFTLEALRCARVADRVLRRLAGSD